MNENITPINIHVDKASATIQFEWSTGDTLEVPLALLRNACPCAECRGGHGNMVNNPDSSMFRLRKMSEAATTAAHLELSGNYALNVTWQDGHSGGIYNWTYLWQLCQLNLVTEVKPYTEN